MKKYFIILLFAISHNETFSQWAILSKETDSLVNVGVNYIYNVEFGKANEIFKQIQKIEPNNPAGYFLDAMVEYTQIHMFPYSKKVDDVFYLKINKVIEMADKLLQKDDMDLNALFFKGGAIGFRGRVNEKRNNYLAAATDGKEAFDILIKCYQKAPNNHDIMLGTGIYNYFAEALPEKMPLLKPIVLFFPKGDKKIGLLQLKAASYKSRYSQVEAKIALIQIYESFENQPYEALQLAKNLFSKYPNNPYFHKKVANNFVRLGEWDSIEVYWRDYVNKALSKKFGYDNAAARDGCYFVGLALERKNDYPNAIKYLTKCEEISEYIKENESGYRSSTNLKLGLIYDKLGKRDIALKYYKKCLDYKDTQDNHARAKKYIASPYR
jgi:tetratricopeptide (TPR) repeat protein